MARKQAAGSADPKGCLYLIVGVVAILGLTWPLFTFLYPQPRTIHFNCATDFNDATNVVSTGCVQDINNIGSGGSGYSGHGTLVLWQNSLQRIRPAGWVVEVAWIALLIMALIVFSSVKRHQQLRTDPVRQHLKRFEAQGYHGDAAKALAERAVREETREREAKAQKDEEDRRTAAAQREAAELNRRLAEGTLARCEVCGRNVDASQGVILTHGSRETGPSPRCEGSGARTAS